MSRYLIINADDFGYNPQQTRAIDELFSEGLISSTSLMSVAPDAKNAAEIAKNKNYPVGIHLTLNSDSEIFIACCFCGSFCIGGNRHKRG